MTAGSWPDSPRAAADYSREGARIEVLARIADAFDVSADFLMFPDAPRRPLRVTDPGLAQRLADLTELAPDDRQSLLHVLDAFLTRKRLQDLTAR